MLMISCPVRRPKLTGIAITTAIMRIFTTERIQNVFLGITYIVLPSFRVLPPPFSVIRVPELRANDASGAIEEAMSDLWNGGVWLQGDNSGASEGSPNSGGLIGSNPDYGRT